MWGGKCLFQLSTPDHSPSLRELKAETQVRNREAGTEEETMGEFYFLACSSWLAHSALKINGTQNNQPRGGTTHSVLSLFTSVVSQEYVPMDLCTGQTYRGIFSIEILSSQVILSCIKLTTKQKPNNNNNKN